MSCKRICDCKTQPNKKSDNWTEAEVDTLLKSIFLHGHLDLDKIITYLPAKSKDHVQLLIRKLSRTAKSDKGTPPELIFNLNNWIRRVELEYSSDDTSNNNGPLELALLLKMLSLDGVLENHPLVSKADDVDYGACYRVLYQAVLGHPIQPVNKNTLDALWSCFIEVSHLVEKNRNIIDDLQAHLNKNKDGGLNAPLISLYKSSVLKTDHNQKESRFIPIVNDNAILKGSGNNSKTLKTYSRKPKSKLENIKVESDCAATSDVLPKQVSVVVESSTTNPLIISGSLQLDGTQVSLNLPERMESVSLKEEEKEILEDITYNPLGIPVEWLKNTFLQLNHNSKPKQFPRTVDNKKSNDILFGNKK